MATLVTRPFKALLPKRRARNEDDHEELVPLSDQQQHSDQLVAVNPSGGLPVQDRPRRIWRRMKESCTRNRFVTALKCALIFFLVPALPVTFFVCFIVMGRRKKASADTGKNVTEDAVEFSYHATAAAVSRPRQPR